jgi:hypothetical protein
MGRAGHEKVRSDYSLEVATPLLLAAMSELVSRAC